MLHPILLGFPIRWAGICNINNIICRYPQIMSFSNRYNFISILEKCHETRQVAAEFLFLSRLHKLCPAGEILLKYMEFYGINPSPTPEPMVFIAEIFTALLERNKFELTTNYEMSSICDTAYIPYNLLMRDLDRGIERDDIKEEIESMHLFLYRLADELPRPSRFFDKIRAEIFSSMSKLARHYYRLSAQGGLEKAM